MRYSNEDRLIYEAKYGYGYMGSNYTYHMRKRGAQNDIQDVCDVCKMPLLNSSGETKRYFKKGDKVALKPHLVGEVSNERFLVQLIPFNASVRDKWISSSQIIDSTRAQPNTKMCLFCHNKAGSLCNIKGEQKELNIGDAVITSDNETVLVKDIEFKITFLPRNGRRVASEWHHAYHGLKGPFNTFAEAEEALYTYY